MLLRRAFSLIVVALSLFAVRPVGAAAQSSPDWMALTWNGNGVDNLVQGDCYDLNAGPNAAGMTLDIMWSVGGGPMEYIGGWPTLDGNGQAPNICTSMGTPVGLIIFHQIRNAAGGPWKPMNYLLNMLPQATGADFNSSQGYAGVDAYLFSVSNIRNRPVRVRFDHDNSQNEEGVLWIDQNGSYFSGIFDHYSFWGNYLITGVQDALSQPGNWTNVALPYTIWPPQPQSLTASPNIVAAGAVNGSQGYRLSAMNGGEVTLSLRYGILNQGQWTWGSESSWPFLYRAGPIGWDGLSGPISTSKCTKPGSYYFYQVKNSLHAREQDWKNISTWLTVTGSGQPLVSSISPAGAVQGWTGTVTISGKELCGVTQLQTTYPGLTFSSVSNPDWSDGTSITATFNVNANAAPGNALVTIPTRGGTKTFFFGIVQVGAVPTITGITPSIAPPGSEVTVTLTGSNLVGPVLSTTWSGLTFSNLVPSANAKSLKALFTVSSTAATGNPILKVTTPTGFVNTSLFYIGIPLPLSREYIYFGDRMIAADSP